MISPSVLSLSRDVVAAARVHALEHDVRVRQVVLELRVDVVLGQDLIIEASIFHSPYAPSSVERLPIAGRHPLRYYRRQSWRAPCAVARGRRAAAARSDGPRGRPRRRRQNLADVVRVDAVHRKGHDAVVLLRACPSRARGRGAASACARGRRRRQVVSRCVHGLKADALHILDGGMQTRRAGGVDRAGLKLVRAARHRPRPRA